MKKVVLTGSLMMLSFGIFAQSNPADLPAEAQGFIQDHFSGATIEAVQVEDEGWLEGLFDGEENDKYEVRLSNGVQLDFNENGNISEVDSKEGVAIPEEVLPAEIRTYVASNYADTMIESWSLDDNEQEVELSNEIDLVFDRDGNFLKEE